MEKKRRNAMLLWLIWLLEGVVVGFGAILPGISGGTLCVAFNMYRPLIETISNVKVGIKKHGIMLGIFILGAAIGFVGLSSLAAMLLERNTVLVTCAFIGFIIGTFPGLWKDAGRDGRSKSSYISVLIGFAVMFGILSLFKTKLSITVAPGVPGYLLCGFLWGLSFIVPGLSSSSLLLFFGLYQPMLAGISTIDLFVLVPMGIGMAVCVLLLSRAVEKAYEKFYSSVSHCVLGIVAATAVIIMPTFESILNVVFIILGTAMSLMFSHICSKIKEKTE